MASTNINNLGNTQSSIASDLTSKVGRSSPTSGSLLQQQISAGGAIDWFSDLNSGKSLPIEARERYPSGTPINAMVNDILGHLGITQ